MDINPIDMKVVNLGLKNSVLNKFVAQMRDRNVQKDSMRFRRNLERLGEIFAYEISQTFNASTKDVVTPLGIASVPVYDDKLVVATILRAGLPLHQGILNYFDDAQNGVKRIFNDTDFQKELAEQGYLLSSANSINWGRLAPQIVYYVSAYCDLLANGTLKMGEKMNVAVPTGNFGNIFAAYLAKSAF